MSRSSTHHISPKRSDAERNRAQILKAARAAFADPDADVSMAEIARQAGVGSATLYRNFANRRDLLEALYVGEIDAVCEAAKTIEGTGPAAVLEAWLRRFYTYFTSKQLVATELLASSGPDAPVFGAGYSRVVSAGQPLLEAARESRQIQGDLTIEQILDMVVAIAKIPGDDDYRAPILQAALEAIRKPTAA
jgi:AcrR family transcriptional regulator